MFKINTRLLPIKAHYFFFMAAMGPILPQMTVYGKELGIPPDVMGFITSILPILYILAKPTVGFLVDYFTNLRKFIFMLIILIMTISFTCFYFVPKPNIHILSKIETSNYKFQLNSQDIYECQNVVKTKEAICSNYYPVECNFSLNNITNLNYNGYLTINTLIASDFTLNDYKLNINNNLNKNPFIYDICLVKPFHLHNNSDYSINCYYNNSIFDLNDCLYGTPTFWLFILFMCLGTIGFNVTNCVSDAICFDMLGDAETMKYGLQRVWGTIGFGLTAFFAGIAVNLSGDGDRKSFLPAIIFMVICSGFDLMSVTKLKLPKLTAQNKSIFNDILNLLKQRDIIIFLIFATFAGVIDSFIIYYMFWHLEEVALKTGYIDSIKLIEGCVVAAECLGGEIIFFLISGKILKKIGYVHCLSFCFFTYAIRLGLISLLTNPWYLVLIEVVMQGATYALCYTCIVAYASAIAPPGTTATVQGLVAGMDDGVGFAIGSLIGGQLYSRFGGSTSFKIYSVASVIACFLHIILRSSKKNDILLIDSKNNKKQICADIQPEQEEML